MEITNSSFSCIRILRFLIRIIIKNTTQVLIITRNSPGPSGLERVRYSEAVMLCRSNVARCFLSFNKPRAWGWPGASADQNCSPHLFVADPVLSDQTVSKHFESSYCLFLSSLLPLLLHFLVQCSSKLFFILCGGLLGSILDLQDDPLHLKHLDFSSDFQRFLKNRLFIFQDGLGSVLEVSWAPFGSSWGCLG